MLFNTDTIQVGDKVCVKRYNIESRTNFKYGVVVKKTKTGQVTVKVGERKFRFNRYAVAMAASYTSWYRPRIDTEEGGREQEKKEKDNEVKDQIRRNCFKQIQNETRSYVEIFDSEALRDKYVKRLRDLADSLENITPSK